MCWHKAGALWEVEIIRGVRAVLLQNQSGSAGEAAGFSVVFREWNWAARLSEWFSFPSYFSRLFCFVQVHNCKKKYRSLSSSSETQHLGCYVQFWAAQCKKGIDTLWEARWRATKIVMGLLAFRREGKGDSIMLLSLPPWVAVERTEPGSSQRCAGTAWGAINTSWIGGSSH